MKPLLCALLCVGLVVAQTTVRNEQLRGSTGDPERIRVTESDGQVAEKLLESVAAFVALLQKIAELETRVAALEAATPTLRKFGVRLAVDTADTTGRTWVFPEPAAAIAVYMATRLTEGVDYAVLDSTRIQLVAEFGDGLGGAVVVADYVPVL